jgi:hypothetical protein
MVRSIRLLAPKVVMLTNRRASQLKNALHDVTKGRLFSSQKRCIL